MSGQVSVKGHHIDAPAVLLLAPPASHAGQRLTSAPASRPELHQFLTTSLHRSIAPRE